MLIREWLISPKEAGKSQFTASLKNHLELYIVLITSPECGNTKLMLLWLPWNQQKKFVFENKANRIMKKKKKTLVEYFISLWFMNLTRIYVPFYLNWHLELYFDVVKKIWKAIKQNETSHANIFLPCSTRIYDTLEFEPLIYHCLVFQFVFCFEVLHNSSRLQSSVSPVSILSFIFSMPF